MKKYLVIELTDNFITNAHIEAAIQYQLGRYGGTLVKPGACFMCAQRAIPKEDMHLEGLMDDVKASIARAIAADLLELGLLEWDTIAEPGRVPLVRVKGMLPIIVDKEGKR